MYLEIEKILSIFLNYIVPIGSLLGIGSFIGLFLSHVLRRSEEFNNNRIRVLRELQASKVTIRQSLVSRTEAYIFQNFYQIRFNLTKNDFYLRETQRWGIKSEEMISDVTNELKTFLSILADVSVFFSENRQIQEKVDELYFYELPKVLTENLDVISGEGDLESWKIQAVSETQEFVQDRYGKPIDELVGLIKKELFLKK